MPRSPKESQADAIRRARKKREKMTAKERFEADKKWLQERFKSIDTTHKFEAHPEPFSCSGWIPKQTGE